MFQHEGLSLSSFADQSFQICEFGGYFNDFCFGPRLHVAADIQVEAIGLDFVQRYNPGEFVDVGEGMEGFNQSFHIRVGKYVLGFTWLRRASLQRNSLSARYPVNGAWPAEMRIDMLAAYLDFRSVRELVLAVSRGEAPPPTRYRGMGRAREAIWVKVIVDEQVAPGIRVRQNLAKVDLAALA
jgi:hypothetical protein